MSDFYNYKSCFDLTLMLLSFSMDLGAVIQDNHDSIVVAQALVYDGFLSSTEAEELCTLLKGFLLRRWAYTNCVWRWMLRQWWRRLKCVSTFFFLSSWSYLCWISSITKRAWNAWFSLCSKFPMIHATVLPTNWLKLGFFLLTLALRWIVIVFPWHNSWTYEMGSHILYLLHYNHR